jgi:hypothetical protein
VGKPPDHADFVFRFVVDHAAVPEFQRRYQAVAAVAVIAFGPPVRCQLEKKIEIPDIKGRLTPPVKIVPFFKPLESLPFIFNNKTDPVSQVVPKFNFFLNVFFVAVFNAVFDDLRQLLFQKAILKELFRAVFQYFGAVFPDP